MHRAKFIFTAIAAVGLLGLSTAPIFAQAPPAAAGKPAAARPGTATLPLEKPYSPVAVTPTGTPGDASYANFREQLAAVAKQRVYAELARLVVAQGFFWEGDSSGDFDPKRSSMENFAAAIGLERGAGSGWSALAAIAAVPDAAPQASRPGVVCAPPPPDYDVAEFDRLTAATGTPAAAWRYPATSGALMRSASRATGAVVETLGAHLVRLLDQDPAGADPRRAGWQRVAAPSGKTGFVASGILMPLRSERVCYQKDVTGRWRIAGYIAAAE
jgi:hypothetical protein